MMVKSCRVGVYWFRTDDGIDYSIQHSEVDCCCVKPESHSYCSFFLHRIGQGITERVSCRGLDMEEERRKFKSRLLSYYNNPSLLLSAAEQVADSFMEVLAVAKATHFCLYSPSDDGSTSTDCVVVRVEPHEVTMAALLAEHVDFEFGLRRRPATRASVVSLLLPPPQPQAAEAADSEDCPICMEEMVRQGSGGGGVVVTKLPCSHSFHRSCVLEWLNNSHVCPLCRFEMPPACFSPLVHPTGLAIDS